MTQQQPTVFDLPKVLAVGIVSPAAAAITARFGVAGTLLGLLLSSVFVTAGVDLLKVYLARVPGAVTSIPGGFRKKSAWGRLLQRMRLPFSKFASLPHPRRRSLIVGSIVAAGISFVVGLIIVTGVEASVGKSLSCWVWDGCSTESSTSTTGDGSTSQSTSTLPSILGGGKGAISNTTPQVPQDAPSNSQQQQQPGGSSPPDTPQSPSQAPPVTPGTGTPGVETPTPTPSPSAQPGQRQGPSGAREDQQQTPSNNAPAEQQPSSSEQQSSSSEQQSSSSEQ